MILEEIFRGNFNPMDLVAPSDPEYRQLNAEVCNMQDDLKSRLDQEDKDLLDEILRKVYTAQAIESESYFCFAFAAGMELQKEAEQQLRILKA